MSHIIFKLALSAFLAASAATNAQAQESSTPVDDWTLSVVPASKSTVAFVDFDSGVSLAARCVNNDYDLIIMGLTEAPAQTTSRTLAFSVGQDDDYDTTVWSVGMDRTTAFSRVPAIVARQLAKGGKLQIVSTDPVTRQRTRYLMQLEPSSTAIAQTLTACGRALVDPRDKEAEGNGQDGLPSSVSWVRMPRPNFPYISGNQAPLEAYAVMTCVARRTGRLEDCQIESENPRGYGFAQAAQRAMWGSQIRLNPEAIAAGKNLDGLLIRFTTNFRMDTDISSSASPRIP